MGENSGTGFVAGLEDVVAVETRLSSVEGEAGELTIAGFLVEELAGRASFEEVLYLLWNDELPDAERLADAFDFHVPSDKVGRRLARVINVIGYR